MALNTASSLAEEISPITRPGVVYQIGRMASALCLLLMASAIRIPSSRNRDMLSTQRYFVSATLLIFKHTGVCQLSKNWVCSRIMLLRSIEPGEEYKVPLSLAANDLGRQLRILRQTHTKRTEPTLDQVHLTLHLTN
jgi:hypothetical protein